MGVFNPNGYMPTNCYDCYEEKEADCDINKGVDSASNYKDSRYPKCPLIEIVRCGECRWCDDKGKGRALICTNPYIDMDIHPSYFCPYGERRTDE